MKLSDKACKLAKPKDKTYKIFDGGGLYLEVHPTGKKLWRLKYRYLGKESRISFGAYPLVTLAEARDERDKAKKLLLKQISPTTDRKSTKAQISRHAENTFKAVALEWYDTKREAWSNNYAYKILKCLEKNVFPSIGDRPIAQITPPELLNDCLKKIEKRGSLDIAGRTKQICGLIFRYGIQTGRCEWNAAENLKGALKTRKTEHFRTLDIKKVPDFLISLERNEARLFERTRRAIWFSLYTFCRPVEIRKARWEDIDFQNNLWIIPAEFMKMGRDHMVPLSNQAITILKEQKKEIEYLATEWVFPNQASHKSPMSDGTVNKAIKRLGYGENMVAHGFRALARTTIRENLDYDSEIIEKQLAHKTKNPLGEAYDRTQFLNKRVKMMQDWADYIDNILANQQRLSNKADLYAD